MKSEIEYEKRHINQKITHGKTSSFLSPFYHLQNIFEFVDVSIRARELSNHINMQIKKCVTRLKNSYRLTANAQQGEKAICSQPSNALQRKFKFKSKAYTKI